LIKKINFTNDVKYKKLDYNKYYMLLFEFNRWYLIVDPIKEETIDQISIILFISLIYCIKKDNWSWNTLYSQIFSRLKTVYKNEKDEQDISKICGFIVNSVEFTTIIIKIKIKKCYWNHIKYVKGVNLRKKN